MGGRSRHVFEGYLYLSPWLIGFVVFTLGPMLASLYLSFTSYDIVSPPTLDRPGELPAGVHDGRPLFWPLARPDLLLRGRCCVPLGDRRLAAAGAAAEPASCAGTTVFRTLFFLPTLTPIVASALLWLWLLQPGGRAWSTTLLGQVGIQGPRWFRQPDWAMPR